MNQFVGFIEKNKFYFLLLFPFLFFFSGIYFRLILGDPSLRSVDPEFVYFMTGLNISEGYFKVIHIDHPGTPLQYLVAIVFRITHFLRGNSTEYIEDVLRHPDLYLSMVNLTITALLAITLFIAGRYVFIKTGSLLYSMLIQTTPFIAVILYEIIGRITPEILIPFPIIALTAFLIGHIADKKEKFSNIDLVILSLIMGFGLSIKLTLIPIWIIPLIIVNSWRGKLITGILSVVFFLIIAFPVTLQIEKFWHWGTDLFMHSGKYGGGEDNIIDPVKLKENLGLIFSLQKHFSYLTLLMIALIPFSFFWFRKHKDPIILKKIIISTAVVVAIVLQAIISGKHYAPRYFLPALLLGPLLIFLFIEIVNGFYSSRLLKSGLMILLAVFIFWNFRQQIGTINYTSQAFEQQITAKLETKTFEKTIEKGSVKIIATIDFGCPLNECALLYSTIWSIHSLKPNYINRLSKIYPNSYQYTLWGDNFHFWGEALNPEKIIAEDTPVYLFLENDNPELYTKVIDKTFKDFTVENELVFDNQVTRERVLKLKISQKQTETIVEKASL